MCFSDVDWGGGKTPDQNSVHELAIYLSNANIFWQNKQRTKATRNVAETDLVGLSQP